MLNADQVCAVVRYDRETGAFHYLHSRGRVKAGARADRMNDRGYLVVSIDGLEYRAHRLAWLLEHGAWPVDLVDHVNGNRSDNRIVNLRSADQSQNQMNRTVTRVNVVGLKGVTLFRGKFRATIKRDGKQKYLGLFSSAEQAHAAYVAAAQSLHGDFARA